MPQTKLPGSQSAQDFLKAVYTLQEECERVSTNALAEALSISAPSVTDMAGRLCAVGLLDYRKHRGVKLTQTGEKTARNVIHRHELIEQFLVEHLGYNQGEAHQEAELMEHIVSDKFVEALTLRLTTAEGT